MSRSSEPAKHRASDNRCVKSRSGRTLAVRLALLRACVFIACLCITGVIAAQAQVPTIATYAGGGLPAAGPATATGISVVGGMGRDPAGNLYFSSFTGTILKMDTSGNLSVFAGTGPCCFSGDGGPATSAQIGIIPAVPNPPVKTDPTGNVYLVDYLAEVVRRIDHTSGIITTVAGTPYSTGFSGAGGPATSAQISPAGLGFDATGDLFISDYNCVVWRVDHVTQIITIVAGNGTCGYSGDGGLATSAELQGPGALALDGAGDLFIADYNLVRSVNATTQIITTVAGGGTTYPPTGVLATQAQLAFPSGLAFDPAGNLLIADGSLPAILRVNHTTQDIAVIAGNFTLGPGFSGDGGPATSAQLGENPPYETAMDLAVDSAGDIFFTDSNNYRVRRIDATTNNITTVAGNGAVGDGGPASSALLFTSGIAVDSSENVFIGDGVSRRVRRVDAATGLISTVAGKDVGTSGGYGGPATALQLNNPGSVALDSSEDLFISEHQLSIIDEVNGASGAINRFAGTGTQGFSGDGGPATSADLFTPRGVAVDANGNLYIADNRNNLIRRVDATTGIITTVAGNTSILHNVGNIEGIPAPGYSGDGGPATSAQLSGPQGVFVDAVGNLFISDEGNNVIRRVDAKTQVITTVAGNYSLGGGFSGDNGPALSARLFHPAGLAEDIFGNLYVADEGNYRVREVNAVTGIITTLAGNGTFTFGGDGGPAASASLWPYLPGLAVLAPDPEGNIRVLVMDGTSGRTRVITIPPVPAVFLASTSLSFASQMVGSSSPPQFLAIANSGTGTLNVTNVGVTGEDAADFIVSPGGTCPGTSFTLAPTASCTIAVTFQPVAPGTRLASINISDNAADSPQTVALQGTGATPIVPYIQVDGGVWVQESSAAVNVGDVVNLGPQPVSGGTWSWTGPNGFNSTSRVLNAVALTSLSNVYTATYTDTDGATSTQAFTITVNSTPIVPYIQVNGGAWQQASSVAVNVGATVNLGPQPQTGGTWSWTGPSGFTSTSRALNGIALSSPSNVYTATYTNTDGATSTQAFTITVNSTPIMPYLQVNGGAWQQIATVTVNPGDTVTLGPQPASGGSWSWTGPSGFSSTSRVINATSLPSPTNTYTATYTNTDGVNSTQAFTITVNSTPIVPYLQVNGGAWQQASSVAVNVGDTVNLGPQPQSGGTWSWTGPNGFTSTSRVLNAVAFTSPSNTYTATYTNTDGVNSTQAFTITINPTPIVPYLQVSGGAWQQASSVAVNAGATVNLGPQPQSGGTWSWTGPSGFSSTSRVLNGVALTSASNVYTATYTNTDGVTSTQIFTITVNPTPIVPYVQVNGGAWQQASSVAVNVGDTVNLGPQPQSGGTWSWTGPSGFSSTSRVVNATSLASASNTYTATYTNTDGATSTQAFTITINPTPITSYIQVNEGSWQQTASVTVISGATVNLGPQPLSGGTWSWTGPNGFSSTSRVLNAIPLTTGSNIYTATYTNADGVNSTQTFTITIN